jgi:hypothetical protein
MRIGVSIDGPMQLYAELHFFWVIFQLLSTDKVSNKITDQDFLLTKRKVRMRKKIHLKSAKGKH